MTSAAAAKGSLWERTIRNYLRECWTWLLASRPRQEGFSDVGDLHAGPLVIQAKDWKDWQSAIRVGLDGAVAQARNAETALRLPPGSRIGVAFVKRARRPVGDAYAVLRVEDLLRLVERAYRKEEP